MIEWIEGIEVRSHREVTEGKDRLEEIEEEDKPEAIFEPGQDNQEENGKLQYRPQVPTAS